MADRRQFLAGIAGAGLLAVAGCRTPERPLRAPPPTGAPRVAGTIADGLNVPWGIAFLPDGRALVAQRDKGSVVLIDVSESGRGRVREVGTVHGATGHSGGEGGLLGLALHPDDADQLYAFVSTTKDDRVVRLELGQDGELGEVEPILTGIRNNARHHGGRLAFGPDGRLYVGTGEAGQRNRAQDRDDLGGKILRITTDGKPAPGNPYGNAVWSWGHRNVEGLSFDADGRLWATEFGNHEVDELNLIEKGGNYGWPIHEGESDDARFVSPKVTWPVADCSPSGMAIAHSTAFVAALRGQRLWSVPLHGTDVGEPTAHFVGAYGRLRTVAMAPGGDLWLTTSNTDGRGRVRNGDDRILRVVLE